MFFLYLMESWRYLFPCHDSKRQKVGNLSQNFIERFKKEFYSNEVSKLLRNVYEGRKTLWAEIKIKFAKVKLDRIISDISLSNVLKEVYFIWSVC